MKDPEADLTTILPKKGAAAAAAAATTSSTWTAETAKVAAPTGKSSKAATTAAVAAAKPIPLASAQPNISSKHVTAQLQRLGWILDGAKLEQSPELLAASLPAVSANALANALNASRSAAATKTSNASQMANSRSSTTAPRHAAAAEKRAAALAAAAAAAAANTKTTMSYTSAIMTAGRQAKISASTTQTFAAKLTDSATAAPTNTTQVTGKQPRSASSASAPAQAPMPQSPSKHAAAPVSRSSTAGIPSLIDSAPLAKPLMADTVPNGQAVQQDRKTPQEQQQQQQPIGRPSNQETPLQQYSLFNDSKPVWECENDAASQKGMNFASAAAAGGAASVSGQVIAAPKFLDNLPPQVDASKAPGYRGSSMSSPVLPKAVISVPANFQGPPSNFSEPPPPIGMNTSPNQKAIGRPGGHGDIGPPPVSQSDNYRHMLSERAADMQRASSGHMHMSSSNMIEQPPPNQQQQQQYTLAPSPGYDHQHPPLLKVVQPGGGQGHHQDASQQHAMMNAYQSNQQANPNMPHYPSGANANQASAASMSPPSMHSR